MGSFKQHEHTMGGALRSRLGVLVVLAAIGLTVAGIGVSFGTPTADSGDAAEFVVSEETVTFSDRNRTVTVADNVSNATTVEIQETDAGRFRVDAERRQPLTDAERERAIEIARTNRTVQERLAAIDSVEITVEPIRKLETTKTVDLSNATMKNTSGNVSIYRFDTNTSEESDGSVIVNRDPAYVENRADVRISDPTADRETQLQYSVTVDLANGTVTDATDWVALRESTPTVTGTEIDDAQDNSTREVTE